MQNNKTKQKKKTEDADHIHDAYWIQGWQVRRTSHEKEWVDKSRKAFQKSKASERIHFQQGYSFSPKYKRRYFRQVLALPSSFDMEWKKND